MSTENKISWLAISFSLLLILLAFSAWKNGFVLILCLLFSAWAIIMSAISLAWLKHRYFLN
ncbi:MAG: hypothetical protein WC441_01190 [Patescibacteria group bacterium]